VPNGPYTKRIIKHFCTITIFLFLFLFISQTKLGMQRFIAAANHLAFPTATLFIGHVHSILNISDI
jgi:hypothetical protein